MEMANQREVLFGTLRDSYSLFEQSSEVAHLQDVIQYSQETVDLTPKRNPNQAASFNNLSILFSTRYKREGKQEDLI